MESLNLMFVVDDGYVDQLKVTLYSVRQQMSGSSIHIYLLQKTVLKKSDELEQFCQKLDCTYHPITIGEDLFKDAPTTDRYPDTIYYRLLAHEFLPQDLDRILYLDADILCLNGFMDFYQQDLGDKLYAAASHNADGSIMELVNKLRLQNYEMDSSYFNTGVLLMNLDQIRRTVERQDILDYIAKNRLKLILPDQDVLNGLYADRVLAVSDEIYNFDARYSRLYQARSNGIWDIDWVMANTVFLHFAGRDKPWYANYTTRYAALYKYLARQAEAL
ncbi:UDP-galactose:(galactosyl) LPS alpha1,2-galactosyltransferase WaaW [Streptococcus criceti]|uniref:Glycosyltransferase, family 8 n=1 Tax=Streptococcus criceti HS-6 TaxID=873449 RepID=G5JNZ3_STRCG|nr:glycosyltransferase family 8 protein [Streptococcus criceti]EHI74990.1 glycosyltransferase, family 8 [Streptococcus criceti HS-6]SUN43403.1 UDP-galactose:(galactosyl) LPS alpha1,2-galactosyltransferase WaaW [Streptococcus criceti]